MMLLSFVSFFLFVSCAWAQNYPNLTLPWGTWQAAPYENDPKIYIFRNVRFGGVLARFGPPAYPNPISNPQELQNSSYGPSCYQIDTSKLQNPPGGPLAVNEKAAPPVTQSEDCLFLDIYVPVSAFNSNVQPLPVVAWIYGGAYAFGTKDYGSGIPLYSGQSVIKASDYKTIFVAGNYRMGAFGWLAGSYMESAGLPNAGLYDQALYLNWIKTYIKAVKGDPTRISAWGESAGAGSILHHLIRQGGTVDPGFSTFLVQSPAYEWAWDNSKGGTLDQVYQNFSVLAGCGNGNTMACLKAANINKLVQANQALFNTTKQTGLFPVGPSIDGKWIQTLPALSLSSGAFWKGISSGIISHVANEAGGFTPKYVVSQATFDQYLQSFMPEPQLAPERSLIRSQYNCTALFGGDFQTCLRQLIRDSTFTCNTRWLQPVPKSAYMMQFTFPGPTEYFNATHASDLVPAFMNNQTEAKNILVDIVGLTPLEADGVAAVYAAIRDRYQAYFAGFGTTGNPNALSTIDWVNWPVVTKGDSFSNVMEVRRPADFRYFNLISDDMNTVQICSFWQSIAANITSKVGK